MLSWSNLSNIFSFSQVLPNATLKKNVETLRSKCKLNRLARVVMWFNDTGTNGKDFHHRFTGKDFRIFLHNFMFLVDGLEDGAEGQCALLIIHVLAYLCL